MDYEPVALSGPLRRTVRPTMRKRWMPKGVLLSYVGTQPIGLAWTSGLAQQDPRHARGCAACIFRPISRGFTKLG